MATAIRNDFNVEVSESTRGFNVPQTVGSKLWAPMFAMSIMGFGAGFVIALVRANELSGGDATTAEALRHFGPGAMFIGFAAVFAAISFAIARILGEFRDGGGRVQEAAKGRVQTLKMPKTAKAFILMMAMAMMVILAAVVAHFVIGAQIAGGNASTLADSEALFVLWEGVRRLGVAIYLVGISLGLATIVTVLRFQTQRVRELAS